MCVTEVWSVWLCFENMYILSYTVKLSKLGIIGAHSWVHFWRSSKAGLLNLIFTTVTWGSCENAKFDSLALEWGPRVCISSKFQRLTRPLAFPWTLSHNWAGGVIPMLLKGSVGGAGGLLTGWGQSGPRDWQGLTWRIKLCSLRESAREGRAFLSVGKCPRGSYYLLVSTLLRKMF